MSQAGERAPPASLGLLDATMVGVDAMIGAGIFVPTGAATELAAAIPGNGEVRIRPRGVPARRGVRDGVDALVHVHGRRRTVRARVLRELRRVRPPLRPHAPVRRDVPNFAVCMVAQRMATVRTVLRTSSPPGEEYDAFVDGVVFPEAFGARAAANEITGGGVRTIEAVGGDRSLEIVEIEFADDAPTAGRTLQEVAFPRGSLIIVDAGGGRIGGADTVLEPGQRYLVAMEADVPDEVANLLHG